MEFARNPAQGRQRIQKYGGGRFTVSGSIFASSVLVLPTKTILWPAASIAELSENAITLLLEYAANIDICLIGCGLKTVLVPASIRQRLKDGGVKADVMDTGAACRTYNVLMAEGRSIAAALVAV